jgi:hypothetical protein
MAGHESDETSKQPFVSQADRPEVRIKSDTPLSELTVRDLATLLGQVGGTGKDFWDGKDWQKDDADGGRKWKDKEKEKEKEKEKDKEKEKPEKWEIHEKPPKGEVKAEKLEVDGVFQLSAQQVPDPRLDQVIQALSGLTARVAQLANQVEELKRAGQG